MGISVFIVSSMSPSKKRFEVFRTCEMGCGVVRVIEDGPDVVFCALRLLSSRLMWLVCGLRYPKRLSMT